MEDPPLEMPDYADAGAVPIPFSDVLKAAASIPAPDGTEIKKPAKARKAAKPVPVAQAAPLPPPTRHEQFREEMRQQLPQRQLHQLMRGATDDIRKHPDFAKKTSRLRVLQRYYNAFPEQLIANRSVSYKSTLLEIEEELGAVRDILAAPHHKQMAKSLFFTGLGAASVVNDFAGRPVLMNEPISLLAVAQQNWDTELEPTWREFVIEFDLLHLSVGKRMIGLLAGLIAQVHQANVEAIRGSGAASRIPV